MQIFIALILGSLLGFERLLAGKEAGMRTFGLVSVGSCLFVIIGEIVILGPQYGMYNFDPLRIASSVVTGIGFIGAGLIIFQHELKGLTTAAALWVASLQCLPHFLHYLYVSDFGLLNVFWKRKSQVNS